MSRVATHCIGKERVGLGSSALFGQRNVEKCFPGKRILKGLFDLPTSSFEEHKEDDSMTMRLSKSQDDDTALLSIASAYPLSHPNEDFGRIDKRRNATFRSTFQRREYSIWATNNWYSIRKSAFHLLFILPKSSFGGAYKTHVEFSG
jgi:hypothetical protein